MNIKCIGITGSPGVDFSAPELPPRRRATDCFVRARRPKPVLALPAPPAFPVRKIDEASPQAKAALAVTGEYLANQGFSLRDFEVKSIIRDELGMTHVR